MIIKICTCIKPKNEESRIWCVPIKADIVWWGAFRKSGFIFIRKQKSLDVNMKKKLWRTKVNKTKVFVGVLLYEKRQVI